MMGLFLSSKRVISPRLFQRKLKKMPEVISKKVEKDESMKFRFFFIYRMKDQDLQKDALV